MGPFEEFPLLTIFVIVVVVLVMFSIFSPKRPPLYRQGGSRASMDPAFRVCGACGKEQPAQARYCRDCGKAL